MISDIFVFALVCLVVSRVQLFVTAWTGARQVPLSMEFPSQEYWSRLPFPTQGIFPTQGSNSHLLHLLNCRKILFFFFFKADSLLAEPLGKFFRI